MNIQTARKRLKDWLSSKIRIDAWDLDEPRSLFHPSSTTQLAVPSMTAIQYPVKDLRYERDGIRTIFGNGAFSYSFVYRYSGLMTAEQLPTQRVEALAQFVHASALLELAGCDGIRQVVPEIEEFPIMFSRMDDDQSDWLVYFNLVMRVQFALTEFDLPPEFSPVGSTPDTELPIDEVSLKIYRAFSGFDADVPADSTLDANIILEA